MKFLIFSLFSIFISIGIDNSNDVITGRIPAGNQNDNPHKVHVPGRFITSTPGHHWFGYYDKLAFDPTGRYVLAMETSFENRSPQKDDVIKVGMIDLEDNDRWIVLGESKAWNWQQGCMLQFLPGSDSEIIWNDREGNRFVCHILDIYSKEKRTLPFPVYTLSPDGQTALSVDFERINNLRRGYGYAGVEDPARNIYAPENSGIYKVDLVTGKKELIISIKKMNQFEFPGKDSDAFSDMKENMNWFNHLLFNTDGSRFVFLHRWKSPTKIAVGGFGTIMYSSDPEGNDIRVVDASGYTSHFIWRDPENLMMWTRHETHGFGFYIFPDDGSQEAEIIGKDIMTRNGHNTYLPGNEWVLNDTYPDQDRFQHVYLYHIPTSKRIPLGDFYLPEEYRSEWRIDTHPRYSPDGKTVVIDSWNEGQGRQLFLMDISEIVN